jgi:hypothetical protein
MCVMRKASAKLRGPFILVCRQSRSVAYGARLVFMKSKLSTLLRWGSIPLVTAALLCFFLTRPPRGINFNALAQATPDCQVTQVFTAATGGAAINNKPTTATGTACTAWIVTYWTNGASSVSVQIQGAPDVAGVPGSYTKLTAATSPVTSANPATGTTNGVILACCDYYPWIQIDPTTFAGTSQTMTVRVYGYKNPTAVAGGGSGGGSGLACLNGDVDAGSGSCTTATVVGLKSVPFCSGYTPTNGQFIEYTTGGSPNPCYAAASAGGGSGVHGTANFTISGGTITASTVTGCVTGVTYASTGNYTVALSGCPANYAVVTSIASNVAFWGLLALQSSISSSGFTLVACLAGNCVTETDPGQVFVAIP